MAELIRHGRRNIMARGINQAVSTLGVKEYLPPYLGIVLGPDDLLTGVSFASGGSGYDPLTSKIASVLSMPEQLELFREYKKQIMMIAGEERAGMILAGSIYLVCAGSDDMANTYFATPFRDNYDLPSYANFLIRSAVSFIVELIDEGAQKIAVVGIPPIGCLPSQRTIKGGPQRNCASEHNQLAQIYNAGMTREMKELKINYPERHMVYIDIYDVLLDIIQRPYIYGFDVSTKGCCGTGDIEVSVLCNSISSIVCFNTSKFVFWDSYHPTEKAYKILVNWVHRNYLNLLT